MSLQCHMICLHDASAQLTRAGNPLFPVAFRFGGKHGSFCGEIGGKKLMTISAWQAFWGSGEFVEENLGDKRGKKWHILGETIDLWGKIAYFFPTFPRNHRKNGEKRESSTQTLWGDFWGKKGKTKKYSPVSTEAILQVKSRHSDGEDSQKWMRWL